MKTKLDYITKQLRRTHNKKYENYVVTGIWHRLNDPTLKFVTQQYVMRPDGRALTDMYFPQLQVHIEVDEGFHQFQINEDKVREADIINATGHIIERVPITREVNGTIVQIPIEHINKRIDEIVRLLKRQREKLMPRPWDLEAELNPQTWVKRGSIALEDDCVFMTQVDGANCFGLNYKPKAIWNGGAMHPIEKDVLIWFPKVYPNKDYLNIISDDEESIREYRKQEADHTGYLNWVLSSGRTKRIVFPRFKTSLGETVYRFKGMYQLDAENSSFENGILWKRISTVVKTYQYA